MGNKESDGDDSRHIDTGDSSAYEDANLRPRKKFTGVALGFKNRTVKTAKLGAKFGFSATKMAIKSKFGSNLGNKLSGSDMEKALDIASETLTLDMESEEGQKKAIELADKSLDIAFEYVEEMDQLKGLVMKLGQMASYVGSSLSPEVQRILARLQSQASALPFEQVKENIEIELRQSIEHLFDSFEPEAVAAASIGQVHKAVVDDMEVAVKVQYPDIEQSLESDLKLLSSVNPFAKIARTLLGLSLNTEELVGELRDRIMEECDYTYEAQNQQKIANLWRNDSKIIIPDVIPKLSSRRVLTSRFMEGLNFYEFKEQATQEEKNKAAETIYRMGWESIFTYAFFNGDPHPGNYLFRDDGEVVFLDFGCICHFSEDFLATWKLVAESALSGDRDLFKVSCEKLGYVGKPKKFDWDYHWKFYQHVLTPIYSDQPFNFSKEFGADGTRIMVTENTNKFAIQVPKPLVLATRLEWGLKSILTDLDATGHWRDIFISALRSEVTPLKNV